MRKNREARVLGPYPEKDRWRLVIKEKGGRRSIYVASEEEARKLKRQIQKQHGRRREKVRTVESLIVEYCSEKQRLGNALPRTCAEQASKLRVFLAPVLNRDVRTVTAAIAERVYLDATEQPNAKMGRPLAVASHRLYLSYTKQLFGWSVKKGYLEENPFQHVAPIGKPNVGKQQLRIDEARVFIDAAIRYYTATQKPVAIAALMALMMGLRASEVLLRRVRDLDDGGRILWIDGGKTKNARRRLRVPQLVQTYLGPIVQGRQPEEFVFASESPGRPVTRQMLWTVVHRLCEQAGVTKVCVHSLRGLYATLAVETGALSEAVAASLGHGSFAVTVKHYAQPSTLANVSTARVEEALLGEGAGSGSER